MSHHNAELYPDHNTDELHAELALHGMTFIKPSMMSDVFRFGWVAALKQRSKEDLLRSLVGVLELDLSNADETRKIIERLEQTND